MRTTLIITGAGVTIVWLILFALRFGAWPLAGVDAYYHLRCAQYLSESGLTQSTLPWTRLSVFAEQWADKEYLFHVFLIPFAQGADLVAGGQVALTTINALLCGIVLFIGLRLFGYAGLLLPVAMLGASLHLWYRLDLLRPHQLSLIILLLCSYQICRRRYKTLAVLAACYGLAYIAWHSLLLLCVGLFVLQWLLLREQDFRLIAYPSLGLAVGVLLHPVFPDNLLIWKLNNVDFYRYASELKLGVEIEPLSFKEMSLSNMAGVVLLLLGLIAYRPRPAVLVNDRNVVILGGCCAAFLLLYVFGARFVEYAAPFTALFAFAVFHSCHIQAAHPPRRMAGMSAIDGRKHVLLFSVFVPLAFALHAWLFHEVNWPTHKQTYFDTPEAVEAFSSALPQGARVAAPWDMTGCYMAAAPQALYLNVLDPVFMHAADPSLPAIESAFFGGALDDPFGVLTRTLQSNHVAGGQQLHRLKSQLSNDRRFFLTYDGPRHFVFSTLVPPTSSE